MATNQISTHKATHGALALGALGILVTCLFYAASPPAAAMPGIFPFNLDLAVAGAIQGKATMQAAGAFGVAGDLIFAAGALLMTIDHVNRGRALAAMGWAAMALSLMIFTTTDLVVGTVLSQLAIAGNISGFHGFKLFFDAHFLLGGMTFSVGVLLAFGRDVFERQLTYPRAITLSAMAVAGISILAIIGCWVGISLNKPVGLSIAAMCVVFIIGSGRTAFRSALAQ